MSNENKIQQGESATSDKERVLARHSDAFETVSGIWRSNEGGYGPIFLARSWADAASKLEPANPHYLLHETAKVAEPAAGDGGAAREDDSWEKLAGSIIDTVTLTAEDYVNEKLVEQLKRYFIRRPQESALPPRPDLKANVIGAVGDKLKAADEYIDSLISHHAAEIKRRNEDDAVVQNHTNEIIEKYEQQVSALAAELERVKGERDGLLADIQGYKDAGILEN